MSEKKSPWIGYTDKEVKATEASMYYIQMGKDMFSQDGETIFAKEDADALYETLASGLSHMIKHGAFEEREEAREILKYFRLMPVRFN